MGTSLPQVRELAEGMVDFDRLMAGVERAASSWEGVLAYADRLRAALSQAGLMEEEKKSILLLEDSARRRKWIDVAYLMLVGRF